MEFYPVQEEEDEDDDNLGGASPTMSNLSGLSSGKMMSSRMLKSVKPTSPHKDWGRRETARGELSGVGS